MISSEVFKHSKKESSVISCSSDSVLAQVFGGNPRAKGQFLNEHFQQRPVWVPGSEKRVDEIVDKFMFGLDISSILENTSSDQIHAWLKAPEGGGKSSLDSISVEEASVALKLHNAGHSLYCRAPPELEHALVLNLLDDTGIGIRNADSDRFRRGEIETFISKKAHVTEWHTDFQENFTFQLSGKKRWFFRESTAVAPLRGSTPHFGDKQGPRVVETQLKALRLGQPSFSAAEFTRGSSLDSESSIVLNPGDFLYHPAGIWHRVECIEDSIAINVSLVGASLAELIGSAVQQMLWVDPRWRAPVRLTEGGQQAAIDRAASALVAASSAIQLLNPSDIMPRSSLYDLPDLGVLGGSDKSTSDSSEEEDEQEQNSSEVIFDATETAELVIPESFSGAKRFRRNLLAVLNTRIELEANGWSVPDLGRHLGPTSDLVLVHINFGNEMFESISRVMVAIPSAGLGVIDLIENSRLRSPPQVDFTRQELLQAVTTVTSLGERRVENDKKSKARRVIPGTLTSSDILSRTLWGLYQCGALSPVN